MRQAVLLAALLVCLDLHAVDLGPPIDVYGPYVTDVVGRGGPPLAATTAGGQRFIAWSEASSGADHLYLAARNGARVEVTRPGDLPGIIASTALASDGTSILAAWVVAGTQTNVALARRFRLDLQPIDSQAMYLSSQDDRWPLAAGTNGSEYLVTWGTSLVWIDSRGALDADSVRENFAVTTHATAAAAKSVNALALVYQTYPPECTTIFWYYECHDVPPDLRVQIVDRRHVARDVTGFNGRRSALRSTIAAAAAEDRFLAVWKAGNLQTMLVSADGVASPPRMVAGLTAPTHGGPIAIAGNTDEWIVAWEELPATSIARSLRILPLGADGALTNPDAMITIDGGATPILERAGDGAYSLTYAAATGSGWTIRTRLLTTKTPGRRRAT